MRQHHRERRWCGVRGSCCSPAWSGCAGASTAVDDPTVARTPPVPTGTTATAASETLTASEVGAATAAAVLIGTFPHTVVAGRPAGPDEGRTARAVLLTVDARSGRARLIGVQTGSPRPEPGATVLQVG